MKKWCIIPFFVPHQGCPHTCVFCNQQRISGVFSAGPSSLEVSTQIGQYLKTIPVDCRVEVAFYGGSFTGLPWERQRELLQPAYQAWEASQVDGIRISTRPDLIKPKILERIKALGVTTVELGVQSLDPEVLEVAQRGHGPEVVEKAVNFIRQAGMKLGLQMMIGLPGDNRERSYKTVSQIIKLQPDFVRIYPTLVIRHTVLERMFHQNDYTPLELDEAVEWTKILYLHLVAQDIPVIRMGLQTTEELLKPGEVVAGPWHPAFGELVQAAVALEQIEVLLKQWIREHPFCPKPLTTNTGLVTFSLIINPRYGSRVVGQHQRNFQHILKKWKVKFKLQTNDSIPVRDLILKDDENTGKITLNWQEFLANYRI